MSIKFKIEGLNELDDLLKTLPDKIERRVLQRATKKAITQAFEVMQRCAPKHETGKQSNNSREYGSTLANLRIENKKKIKKGQKGSIISTGSAFWAYIYEIGSRRQPARPWFAPAFRSMQDAMLETLKAEIGAGIEREAKKRS